MTAASRRPRGRARGSRARAQDRPRVDGQRVEHRDRVRDLALSANDLDHRSVRRRPGKSTGHADPAQPRGMAPRSTRPAGRDLFLETVGSLRDLVQQSARTATWRATLACLFAWASQQLPMPNENAVTRALLLLTAVGLGALVGKRLDRRKHRRP